MASWRPPGSILEAPGLDFGGFGDDFLMIFDEKLELISNSNFKLCDCSFEFKFQISSKPEKTKISRALAEPQDACLESLAFHLLAAPNRNLR